MRITLPDAPLMHRILPRLLARLRNYPLLRLDWRMNMRFSDKVGERIDLGVRMGNAPDNNGLVVKQAAQFSTKIVASPDLLARCGQPQNWHDLPHYPLLAELNHNTGRAAAWVLSDEIVLTPTHPSFLSGDLSSLLCACLQGCGIGCLHDTACAEYLATGALVELFPEVNRKKWGVYVYRAGAHITPPRVKKVFDLLVEVIGETAQEK